MKSGILVIDKQDGWTSFDVIGKLRTVLHIKKMGHTGTLDPMATGVLPICIGKATKLVSSLENDEKTYETEFELGWTTDTQDSTGTTISKSEVKLSEAEVEKVILSFVGPYLQTPPMYSAQSIGGKRLYQLAREGIEVERAAKERFIKDISEIKFNLPKVSMKVSCSKGTYIRTLCADIGDKLGVGGCMTLLRRVRAGRFSIDQSLRIEEVIELTKEGRLESHIMKVDELLSDYPALYVSEGKSLILYNGGEFVESDLVKGSLIKGQERYRVYLEDNTFIGVYDYKEEEALFKIWKMFKE